MEARLVLSFDVALSERAAVHMVAWELPRRLPGSEHNFKYRFTLVIGGVSVLRYDNEAGKGDHRHSGRREFPYRFVSLDEAQVDFWQEVERWQSEQGV